LISQVSLTFFKSTSEEVSLTGTWILSHKVKNAGKLGSIETGFATLK